MIRLLNRFHDWLLDHFGNWDEGGGLYDADTIRSPIPPPWFYNHEVSSKHIHEIIKENREVLDMLGEVDHDH
jgi:hypothetical protein